MWELAAPMPYSATFQQSKQFLEQIWHTKPPTFPLSTPFPEAALCNSLQCLLPGDTNQVPLRNLCQAAPRVPRPLHNLRCL